MGSSGEMATAERMKGERVVCSNAVLRAGQMEQLSANRGTGLSPACWVGRGVCLCIYLHACLSFAG